jgi:hypothetical protein
VTGLSASTTYFLDDGNVQSPLLTAALGAIAALIGPPPGECVWVCF